MMCRYLLTLCPQQHVVNQLGGLLTSTKVPDDGFFYFGFPRTQRPRTVKQALITAPSSDRSCPHLVLIVVMLFVLFVILILHRR